MERVRGFKISGVELERFIAYANLYLPAASRLRLQEGDRDDFMRVWILYAYERPWGVLEVLEPIRGQLMVTLALSLWDQDIPRGESDDTGTDRSLREWVLIWFDTFVYLYFAGAVSTLEEEIDKALLPLQPSAGSPDPTPAPASSAAGDDQVMTAGGGAGAGRRKPGPKADPRYIEGAQRVAAGESLTTVIDDIVSQWIATEQANGLTPDASLIDAERKRVRSGIAHNKERRQTL